MLGRYSIIAHRSKSVGLEKGMKKGSQWLPFLWTLLLWLLDRNRRHSSRSSAAHFTIGSILDGASHSCLFFLCHVLDRFARRFNRWLSFVFLVNGEFDCIRRSLGSQVVHAGLQAFLPGIEMHGSQLLCIHVFHEYVE